MADKVKIELAYAIGIAKSVSIAVDTFETGKGSENKLARQLEV